MALTGEGDCIDKGLIMVYEGNEQGYASREYRKRSGGKGIAGWDNGGQICRCHYRINPNKGWHSAGGYPMAFRNIMARTSGAGKKIFEKGQFNIAGGKDPLPDLREQRRDYPACNGDCGRSTDPVKSACPRGGSRHSV